MASTGNKKGTFFHDEKLPPLPVPSVDQTIEKYLDSCRAILSPGEYINTVKICQEFVRKDAEKLQELLLKHASKHRNWIEDWWLDKAYLESRSSLLYTNGGGISDFSELGWMSKPGTQCERMAYGLYIFMQLWKEVSEETMPPQKGHDGRLFSMHQLRYLYNTCRIPQRGKDRVHHGFKTKAEGGSATYAVVICNGYFFRLETINKQTGEIYTPPYFEQMFIKIKNICKNRPPAPGVCTLTYLDRDSWSDARNHLIDISEINRENIALVEDALVHITLLNCSMNSLSAICKGGLAYEPGMIWADKLYSYLIDQDGNFFGKFEHSPCEGMVPALTHINLIMWLKTHGPKWKGSKDVGHIDEPTELVFNVDDKICSYIRDGEILLLMFSDKINARYVVVDDFGRSEILPYKIHPDFFVQICIQLAYIRQMNKPAPTYETATTRQYYNGRTETVRTCTPEAIEFCQAMINGHTNAVSLLMKANNKFVWLMNQCKDGYGCDRHLMGLALIAMENNLPLPPIFTDPSYVKTGGNGNYVLSTSCTGYWSVLGGCAPMREDGYGCFYYINKNKFVFFVSSWINNPQTDSTEYIRLLKKSMNDVFNLLQKSSSKL